MANFYVDLVNGDDTTGTGTIALPWKTLAKATAVGGARTIGDVVYVAKTPGDITLIGSGTTANNQLTINTVADYTGSLAAKDYISLDPSGFPVFQISTITSSVITLAHYPWFEAGSDTGLSTVSIYKVPTIDTNTTTQFDSIGVSGNEIPNIRNTPFDTNLTYGYNILITGGWNSDFTLQDGYTLVRNTNPAAGGANGSFIRGNTGVDGYKMVRFGGLNFLNYYQGSLGTENRMVYEDCIFGYNGNTTSQVAFFKDCKSYCGNIGWRFYVGSTTTMNYYNTPTETNVPRPAMYNHTHYLGYTEYSITTAGVPQSPTANRGYNGIYVKGLALKSCIRTSDVVAGESNIGKFAIIPNAATIVRMTDVSITKNPNISIGLARIFNAVSYNNISIDIDTTLLNSVMYSTSSASITKQYCYIESTNGDILSIPGTFKTSNGGDTGNVFPYSNNVVINGDGTRFQYDCNLVSSVDNTVYSAGTNSVKITKITNHNGSNGYFIGEIELTDTTKTVTVVCKGSKTIDLVSLRATYTPINLGSAYFPLSSNFISLESTSTTLTNASWTTLTLTLPAVLLNTSSKIKLALMQGGGSSMLNGDSIWIDSITIS